MLVNNKNDESLFYCDIENNEKTKKIITVLKNFSIEKACPVYILKKILGAKDYYYDINEVAIILIVNYPILIVNFGSSNEDLENFCFDLKEDFASLAKKYNYEKILGRSRGWSSLFKAKNINELNIEEFLSSPLEKDNHRKIELLISLGIGSINDISKLGSDEPETVLQKIKQKIILFDSKQSQFIYQENQKKTITIQGMAGTGKTELLLHKLKDIYSSKKDSIIAFTCFNKVLANEMKTRIPNFFNFLKVEEQIEWEKRLFVFSSWGSAFNPSSGLYSYVANYYNLPFNNYKQNRNFNELCKNILLSIESLDNFTPCFDYIFIDESQDFKKGFFDLCQKVAKEKIYIAGDIFQNIFETKLTTSITPDFLLNKCYRTDPKTLMFAHAVGMGLYETPQLNWLDDEDWKSCGYTIENKSYDEIVLGRQPLRRFEDLLTTNTIQLVKTNSGKFLEKILNLLQKIKSEYPDVIPDDITIIILGEFKEVSKLSEQLSYEILDKFDWNCTQGFISKRKIKNEIYISNVNNIKGLEFPFAICVALQEISDNILFRNSIYMALTRSFLISYFVIDEKNDSFYRIYKNALKEINTDGKMTLHKPNMEERDKMKQQIEIKLKKRTSSQILDEFFTTECSSLPSEERQHIKSLLLDKEYSENDLLQKAKNIISNL